MTTELEKYDHDSEGPYHHIWWLDDLYEQSLYFNAPTAGLDLNSTYEVINDKIEEKRELLQLKYFIQFY